MRATLQKKFFLSILLVAAVFVGLFAAVYTTGYDKYVVYRKQQQLLESFNSVKAGFNAEGFIDGALIERGELDGLRFMTTDENGFIDYNSLLLYTGRAPFESFSSYASSFKLSELVPRAFGSDAFFEVTKDKTDEGYLIFTAGDRTTGMQFLGLLGSLGDGRMILVQLPTPLIESNSEYTGVFLRLVGFAALAAAMALGYLLSRSLTRRVGEISSIAEGMAQLDFSRRYTGGADDDVGELGLSINKLSSRLEQTIDELRQEIQHAKELEEMRKNLLINVSHELKTPIAIIQGYAEGLRENVNADSEGRDFYCGVIEDEAKHMARLVGDLLSVSRIEAGATKPQLEQFELDELIEGLMEKVGVEADKRGVTLSFAKGGHSVNADEGMTEQVLYNYLSNAVDHAPDRGKIEISCAIRQDGALRVSVFNEGEHIPEDEIPKIWESFYKVDKSRSRVFGGTGIGLAIVRASMEAQKMPYGANNLEGGVEFWFDVRTGAAPEP